MSCIWSHGCWLEYGDKRSRIHLPTLINDTPTDILLMTATYCLQDFIRKITWFFIEQCTLVCFIPNFYINTSAPRTQFNFLCMRNVQEVYMDRDLYLEVHICTYKWKCIFICFCMNRKHPDKAFTFPMYVLHHCSLYMCLFTIIALYPNNISAIVWLSTTNNCKIVRLDAFFILIDAIPKAIDRTVLCILFPLMVVLNIRGSVPLEVPP